MAIRPSKISIVSDGSDVTKIQPSEINPMTLPSVPTQDDIWLDISGTTPTRTIALKVYDNGAWQTLMSVTY